MRTDLQTLISRTATGRVRAGNSRISRGSAKSKPFQAMLEDVRGRPNAAASGIVNRSPARSSSSIRQQERPSTPLDGALSRQALGVFGGASARETGTKNTSASNLLFSRGESREPGPPKRSNEWPWSEWRDYFYTHQPPEWMSNPESRARFEEIFGAKALVTLDFTGTVPENIYDVWVTHTPVDATGRPIPAPRIT